MRFLLDPSLSRFAVNVFATGLLSFLGHSPTFAVRDFAGKLSFNGNPERGLQVEIAVNANAIRLVDEVKPADRQEIEATMRRDVLETANYPEIVYRTDGAVAEAIAPGRYRLRLDGWISLRSVTHEHQVDAELLVFGDGIRLRGGSALRMSDYRIKPVTAAGGTIRLRDELDVAFDIAGLPEKP
jgi:polyisoprenoid-binding protein YceI